MDANNTIPLRKALLVGLQARVRRQLEVLVPDGRGGDEQLRPDRVLLVFGPGRRRRLRLGGSRGRLAGVATAVLLHRFPIRDEEFVEDGEEVEGLDEVRVLVEETTNLAVPVDHDVVPLRDARHLVDGVEIECVDDVVVLLLLALVQHQVDALAQRLHVLGQRHRRHAAGLGQALHLLQEGLHVGELLRDGVRDKVQHGLLAVRGLGVQQTLEGRQLEAVRGAALGAVHVVAEGQNDLEQLLEAAAVDHGLARLQHAVDLRPDGLHQLVEEPDVRHHAQPALVALDLEHFPHEPLSLGETILVVAVLVQRGGLLVRRHVIDQQLGMLRRQSCEIRRHDDVTQRLVVHGNTTNGDDKIVRATVVNDGNALLLLLRRILRARRHELLADFLDAECSLELVKVELLQDALVVELVEDGVVDLAQRHPVEHRQRHVRLDAPLGLDAGRHKARSAHEGWRRGRGQQLAIRAHHGRRGRGRDGHCGAEEIGRQRRRGRDVRHLRGQIHARAVHGRRGRRGHAGLGVLGRDHGGGGLHVRLLQLLARGDGLLLHLTQLGGLLRDLDLLVADHPRRVVQPPLQPLHFLAVRHNNVLQLAGTDLCILVQLAQLVTLLRHALQRALHDGHLLQRRVVQLVVFLARLHDRLDVDQLGHVILGNVGERLVRACLQFLKHFVQSSTFKVHLQIDEHVQILGAVDDVRDELQHGRHILRQDSGILELLDQRLVARALLGDRREVLHRIECRDGASVIVRSRARDDLDRDKARARVLVLDAEGDPAKKTLLRHNLAEAVVVFDEGAQAKNTKVVLARQPLQLRIFQGRIVSRLGQIAHKLHQQQVSVVGVVHELLRPLRWIRSQRDLKLAEDIERRLEPLELDLRGAALLELWVEMPSELVAEVVRREVYAALHIAANEHPFAFVGHSLQIRLVVHIHRLHKLHEQPVQLVLGWHWEIIFL
eukprot:m.236556 g.236556  ORF g.236556 m.236556 type:complete len:946 (-) comp12989_c0_seq1:123-2960(-)